MSVYAITGITGRVGGIVANELLARGQQVRALVRDGARAAPWKDRGAEVVVGSLVNEQTVAAVLRGAAGFFAMLPENDGPDDFHGVRRRMADAIADAVTETRVPHVVMLSASAAVLPEGNGPAKDLHYLEKRLARCLGTITVLRACYFQDNIGAAIAPALASGIYPNFMPSADVAFPMIATRDVGTIAADLLIATPSRSEVIDALGPTYSISQVAEALAAALGKAITIVDIPPEAHVSTLTQAGVPQQLAEAVAEMFAAFRAGPLVPQGDRRVMGATTIDTVIAECVKRAAPSNT